MKSADDGFGAVRRLIIIICALIAFGYLCIRTLRFTNDGLNIAFVFAFFLLPFLAIGPVRQLHGWRKVSMTILLTPVLTVSMAFLLTHAACDIPAYVGHRELSRELGSVQQGPYSVHLLWEETAGGAIGPHGVGLEQRMFIFPGLYAVKQLDYFEEATHGSLSVAGVDKVKVHIPKYYSHEEVDQVYSLKRRVYF